VRVRWSKGARADLLDIFEHVAQHDPPAARRLMARIREAVRAVADQPRIGRMVPELNNEAVRERIVPPYRILYVFWHGSIEVTGVYHSKRDLAALLGEK
jgi:toxin ParE1/3/4